MFEYDSAHSRKDLNLWSNKVERNQDQASQLANANEREFMASVLVLHYDQGSG